MRKIMALTLFAALALAGGMKLKASDPTKPQKPASPPPSDPYPLVVQLGVTLWWIRTCRRKYAGN